MGLHYIHHTANVFLGSTRKGMIQGISEGACSVPWLEPAAYLHEVGDNPFVTREGFLSKMVVDVRPYSHAPC